MGWVSVTPSRERVGFWRFNASGGHKVALWPHPNTNRIDPKFRIDFTSPVLIPLASRWGFIYWPDGDFYGDGTPETDAFGWFDFETISKNHIAVTIPENEWGYSAQVDLESFDSGPPGNEQGVEVVIALTKDTGGTQVQRASFFLNPIAQTWQHNHDTMRLPPNGGWILDNLPMGWPVWLKCQIFAASECYPFIEEDVGMASFNGTDAYIKLTDLIAFSNHPFKFSAEIRLNQTVNQWPILGRQGTGGFFGMEDDDILFGNLTLDTSWTPVQDVWFTWVYEFEPETQLQHKLTIAGTVVRDSTNSRQTPRFDTIGVYKEGVSGTVWADMDVRDLKIETGTPGNYDTLLDMPLRANALDLSPNENHGTTFNMNLPSV